MPTIAVADPAARQQPPAALNLRLRTCALIASASFVFYILGKLADGPLASALTAIGVGACGWAWLLTRALFDPEPHDARWPLAVAGLVAVTGAIAVLAPPDGVISRVADNAYALSGSGALLLTFIEPFHRWRRDLAVGEKRFRLLFVGGYAVLVAVAILGFRSVGQGPDDLARDNLIRAGCAAISLAGVAAALWFRRRHPLEAIRSARREPTSSDRQLAERLTRLLAEDGLQSRTDLKIADIAARVNEPEHRVSQAIGALGFANFNRWINHHRIEAAKVMLADGTDKRSILQIAFDSGFASLGPFNRAFREATGTTPRDYRARNR